MFITTREIQSNNWTTAKQNDSGFLTFTLDGITKVNKTKSFHVGFDGRKDRGVQELTIMTDRRLGIPFWLMHAGQVFKFYSAVKIDIPENVAVQPFLFDFMSDNGMMLNPTIYHGPYKGCIEITVYNPLDAVYITPGTTVGHLTFMRKEIDKYDDTHYDGAPPYNREE